ncbi:MAG: hypothetical protein NZM42_07400 [Gemmatales bacterium]|nr:hypothetical protein [Gemmatales bacterium]MDW8221731.1 hypothetical protein [Gemmatales bacterium]
MSESTPDNLPSPDGQGHRHEPETSSEEGLPPVEPPSARLIAQLFLIPGVVVAVLVGLVWLFFGWLAPGSYEPHDFLQGLRSQHDPVRWRTAQDLAQILPRKLALRLDVGFALDLTVLLEEELNRESSAFAAGDPGQAPHLAEFLPAALGHFHVPIGVPVLCRMVRGHVRNIEYLEGSGDGPESRQVNVAGLRVRNSLVALANLGGRIEELAEVSEEDRQRLALNLQQLAAGEGRKAELARLAWQYWEQRRPRLSTASSDQSRPTEPTTKDKTPRLVEELHEALTLAVHADDEMSRKFACLALANWPEPELEPLLLELLRRDDPPRLLESATPQRAVLEIQYNAALALLRRHSARTPWRLIEELLDESVLAQRYRDDSPSGYDAAAVSMVQLAVLRTLLDAERRRPGFVRGQEQVVARLQELQSSRNPAVQMEARRILGLAAVSAQVPRRVSRELLLLIGVASGVGILLLVAVIARWKRYTGESPQGDVPSTPRPSSLS